MLTNAYDEMPRETFIKSCRKLWPAIEKSLANTENENPTASEENLSGNDNLTLLGDLQKLPEYKSLEEKDVPECIDDDNELQRRY